MERFPTHHNAFVSSKKKGGGGIIWKFINVNVAWKTFFVVFSKPCHDTVVTEMVSHLRTITFKWASTKLNNENADDQFKSFQILKEFCYELLKKCGP